MLSKKKKFFIIGGFCLLLAVTGALNIVLNNNILKTNAGGTATTGNFFVTYRSDRQETRNQEMLYLDAIISSASSSQEAKTAAETKRTETLALMEKELTLEGLIKSKGFDDVIVSTSNGNVNVIVKSAAQLQDAEVAQIVDIINNQTNYILDNIKIIPVE